MLGGRLARMVARYAVPKQLAQVVGNQRPPGYGRTVSREGVERGRTNRVAMTDLSVKRTLVKSPPELWSELSEVGSLARHLGELGEIKISRLEPEHTVAWEGDKASGTVQIEASGWGTKVTLTAEVEEPEPEPVMAEPEPEPEPPAEEPPVMATSKPGLFSRWFFRQRTEVAAPETELEPQPEPEPDPLPSADHEELIAVLEGTLDSLGSAHHRPFSRG